MSQFRNGAAWLFTLIALPAVAVTPAVAANMTHEITAVWVPATVYGLTLIAAFGQIHK